MINNDKYHVLTSVHKKSKCKSMKIGIRMESSLVLTAGEYVMITSMYEEHCQQFYKVQVYIIICKIAKLVPM